jgi:uncharacterized membrane protein
MKEKQRRGPLMGAGMLLGAGLGGFVDGILFHQILQWHHMLSALLPPNDIVSLKINMFWDGIFHAALWVMTAMGLALLWRAGQRSDVPWSGRTFIGSLMLGWGFFNIVEGLMDHQGFGLHHVVEAAANHKMGDMAFLAFGAVMLAGGWGFIVRGRRDTLGRGGAG